jgi:hypothetical protein
VLWGSLQSVCDARRRTSVEEGWRTRDRPDSPFRAATRVDASRVTVRMRVSVFRPPRLLPRRVRITRFLTRFSRQSPTFRGPKLGTDARFPSEVREGDGVVGNARPYGVQGVAGSNPAVPIAKSL